MKHVTWLKHSKREPHWIRRVRRQAQARGFCWLRLFRRLSAGAGLGCVFLFLVGCTLTARTRSLSAEAIDALGFNFNPPSCPTEFCETDPSINPGQLRYKYLGANVGLDTGKNKGTWFRVFAPNAKKVQLELLGKYKEKSKVGLTTRDEDRRLIDMERYDEHEQDPDYDDEGVWSVFVAGVGQGEAYRYVITNHSGAVEWRNDVYARFVVDDGFGAQKLVGEEKEKVWSWKSVVWNHMNYTFSKKAVENRKKFKLNHLRIFEFHPHTLVKRRWEEGVAGWKRITEEVLRITKKHNYNAVSLMPVAHHNLAESWGYHVNSYFSVSYRHGEPDDFKRFVNAMHENGIAVLLDMVHSHTGVDKNTGLAEYDGTELYLQDNPKMRCMPTWGSYMFDYNKEETRNLLLSNALFWIDEYHIDGFRFDAVDAMYDLTYDRAAIVGDFAEKYFKDCRVRKDQLSPGKEADWDPVPGSRGYSENPFEWKREMEYSHNVNVAARDYLREVNRITRLFAALKKDTLDEPQLLPFVTIAETNSTDYTATNYEHNDQALGFDFRWRMGGQADIRTFVQKFPNDEGGNLGAIFDPGRKWGRGFINYINSHDETRYMLNQDYRMVDVYRDGKWVKEKDYNQATTWGPHHKRYVNGLGGFYLVDRKAAEDKEHDRMWGMYLHFDKDTQAMAQSKAKPGDPLYPYYVPVPGQEHMGLINMDYTGLKTPNPDELEQMIDFSFSMHRNLDALIHLVYPGMNMGFQGSEVGAVGRWEDMQIDMAQNARFDEGPRHEAYGRYMAALGDIYLSDDAFANSDNESVRLLVMDETTYMGRKNRMLVSARLDRSGQPKFIIAQNYMHHHYDKFMIPLPEGTGPWKLVFNSDAKEFGGRGTIVHFGNDKRATQQNMAIVRQGMGQPWIFAAGTAQINRGEGAFHTEGKTGRKGVWVNNFPPFTTLVLERMQAD